jgi:hypothetical protein
MQVSPYERAQRRSANSLGGDQNPIGCSVACPILVESIAAMATDTVSKNKFSMFIAFVARAYIHGC